MNDQDPSVSLNAVKQRTVVSFFKGAQAGGQTWDLMVFVYFLSLMQRLRPLGYCAPLAFRQLKVAMELFSNNQKTYYSFHF